MSVDKVEMERRLCRAVIEFQNKAPIIGKHKSGYNYQYAPHDYVMQQIRGILYECNLSVSFSTEKTDVDTCIYVHINYADNDGASEWVRAFTVGELLTGKTLVKNRQTGEVSEEVDQKDWGGDMTYIKRYALISALNLIVADEDKESNESETRLISEKQVETIENILSECAEGTEADAMSYFGVDDWNQVTVNRYKDLKSMLEVKRKQARSK